MLCFNTSFVHALEKKNKNDFFIHGVTLTSASTPTVMQETAFLMSFFRIYLLKYIFKQNQCKHIHL